MHHLDRSVRGVLQRHNDRSKQIPASSMLWGFSLQPVESVENLMGRQLNETTFQDFWARPQYVIFQGWSPLDKQSPNIYPGHGLPLRRFHTNTQHQQENFLVESENALLVTQKRMPQFPKFSGSVTHIYRKKRSRVTHNYDRASISPPSVGLPRFGTEPMSRIPRRPGYRELPLRRSAAPCGQSVAKAKTPYPFPDFGRAFWIQPHVLRRTAGSGSQWHSAILTSSDCQATGDDSTVQDLWLLQLVTQLKKQPASDDRAVLGTLTI